jgi:hypothetical protein
MPGQYIWLNTPAMDRDLFQQRLRELGGLNRLEPDNEGAGAWIR